MAEPDLHNNEENEDLEGEDVENEPELFGPEQEPLNRRDEGFGIESEDDGDWVEPDYDDKEWLKKSCLSCQTCHHTYDSPGDALNCFDGHEEKYYRCHLCFTLVKRDSKGMNRLFKHYQQRHAMGDQELTLICPYCDESVAYKLTSLHAIQKHWREALGK